MKNQSKLSSLFFGKRIPIEKNKLNYKQLKFYEWNKIMRLITNLFYFVLYNAFFGYGYYSLFSHNDNSVLSYTGLSSVSIMCVIGQATTNGCHYLLNRFSKEKTRKDMIDNGNPIPKKSGVGIFFLIMSLIPLTIYIFGAIVILIQCRIYKRKNGNYLREENKLSQELELKKVDKQTTIEDLAQFLRKAFENK